MHRMAIRLQAFPHRVHVPSSQYVRVDIPQSHSAPRASLLSGLARSAGSAGPYARAVRPGNRGVAIYGHGCGVNSSKAGSAAPPLLMRPPRDRLARHGPASTSSWSMPTCPSGCWLSSCSHSLSPCPRARRGTSARATDCAGKRTFGNRVAAWPKLAPDRYFGYI